MVEEGGEFGDSSSSTFETEEEMRKITVPVTKEMLRKLADGEPAGFEIDNNRVILNPVDGPVRRRKITKKEKPSGSPKETIAIVHETPSGSGE